jgi:DNA invertase Pin-like site-specific DNA recombinase
VIALRAGILYRLSEEKDTSEKTQDAFERFEQVCRRLCEQRGWQVTEVFNEGIVSAYKENRKRDTFELAMRALESKQVDVLVVPYVDRFCRGYREPARAEEAMAKSGGDIVDSSGRSAREDDSWHVLVGVAIAESKRISRRVRAQQAQAATKGRVPPGGRRLYGMTKGRTELIEDEARIVRGMARRVLAGRSLRSIASWANSEGARTSTGNLWTQRAVRTLLLSPGLAKQRVYHDKIVAEGTWKAPAVLPRERWEQVRAILNENHRPRAGRPTTTLLGGIAACGICDQNLWGHPRPKHRGGALEYICPKAPGRPGCGRLTVVAAPLEQITVAMVLHRLSGPGMAKARAAEQEQVGASIAAELTALDAQIKELEDGWRKRQWSIDSFLRMFQPLDERREELRGQLQQQARRSVLWSLPTERALLDAWWAQATMDQRRAVLMAVVERVVVGPAVRSSRTFDPARLAPPYGPIWKA